MTLDQVIELLRRQCAREGSQAAWAKRHGVSPAYVSDVIHRRRDPAGKLLTALRIERIITYERIENG